jgi:Xaa-Pro aminopeptidase
MKTDIDELMAEQGVDYLLVTGPAQHNPAMVYLTGGGHLTRADLIKKRGEEPVLFHSSMERDEATRTGLVTRDFDEYRITDLLKQTGGDMVKAIVKRYQHMLADLEIKQGRMALYGQIDAGAAYAIFSALQQAVPDITFLGQMDNSLLLQAMATKDEDEVERIRRMGEITTAVVGQVAEFLTSHRVVNEVLVKSDGQPLTVGEVKRRVNLWLAERGVENPHGIIFAIERDAGIPHSSGTPTDELRLGKTIVFDIFPCEAGGGYHYDFTRTWCLGYAPDEVLAIYEDVSAVYLQIMNELEPGLHCPEFQRRTCDLFEAKGHPTIQSNQSTQDGYVHSLGHGLGLNVHERPWFGHNASAADRLDPGSVVTIEPGLYYPERGLGVRLEDTVWVRPDGGMEVLAEFPLDLILRMK